MTVLTGRPGRHAPAPASSRGPGRPGRPTPRTDPRIRLSAGAAALLCTALAARGNRVGAGEQGLFRAVNGLPDALYPPGWVVMQLGTLGAVPAAATAAWLAGDRELAGRLITAGSVTWLLSKGVKLAVRRDRPAILLPGSRGRGRDAAGLARRRRVRPRRGRAAPARPARARAGSGGRSRGRPVACLRRRPPAAGHRRRRGARTRRRGGTRHAHAPPRRSPACGGQPP